MMTVWRIRNKIIGTVLQCCVVYQYYNCEQWHTHAHTHEQFLQLTVGSRLHTAEGSRQTATILLSNVQSTFFKREAGVNELNQYPAALTVLWHCWLDVRNSIRPVQNWVMRCCLKQSANDLQCSTDVIATSSSLASLKSIMVYRYLSCANLSQLSWKRPLGVCFLGRNVNEKVSNHLTFETHCSTIYGRPM